MKTFLNSLLIIANKFFYILNLFIYQFNFESMVGIKTNFGAQYAMLPVLFSTTNFKVTLLCIKYILKIAN